MEGHGCKTFFPNVFLGGINRPREFSGKEEKGTFGFMDAARGEEGS